MKNYTFALSGIFVLLLVISLSWASRTTIPSTTNHLHADPVATHNMLVVGEKAVYLSHLPMFQRKGKPPMPHRYQVILEVGFEKQGSNPQESYLKDRQGNPSTKIYTMNPENFILPALVSPKIQGALLTGFKGTIVRGHFEKENKIILPDVDIKVKRVVYFKNFDSISKKSTQLEYLLFGKGQELFLTHLITTPPDFDQVLSITVNNHSFSDEVLAKGVKIVFQNTLNSPSGRLKEKQQVQGAVTANSPSAPLKMINIKVNKEFYFEEGELQVPPDFDTTPEEKKSGFF